MSCINITVAMKASNESTINNRIDLNSLCFRPSKFAKYLRKWNEHTKLTLALPGSKLDISSVPPNQVLTLVKYFKITLIT
jgi:hypothetical protein